MLSSRATAMLTPRQADHVGGPTSAGALWLPTRARLRGRSSECALLDDLASAIQRGESRSLVVRGEAGIGKTVL